MVLSLKYFNLREVSNLSWSQNTLSQLASVRMWLKGWCQNGSVLAKGKTNGILQSDIVTLSGSVVVIEETAPWSQVLFIYWQISSRRQVTWVLAPGASLPLSKVLKIRTGKQSLPDSLMHISSGEWLWMQLGRVSETACYKPFILAFYFLLKAII